MFTQETVHPDVPIKNETVMIVLYLLCLHPQTLKYIVKGEGSAANSDQEIIDLLDLKFPHAKIAFQTMHNSAHFAFIATMFEGFNRDFLQTLREYDRLDGTHLKAFDDDYDDPNTCPGDDTIGGLLPAA